MSDAPDRQTTPAIAELIARAVSEWDGWDRHQREAHRIALRAAREAAMRAAHRLTADAAPAGR